MEYTVRKSARARRLQVSVYAGGEVIVTKPRHVSDANVATFVASREAWIREAHERLEQLLAKRGSAFLPRLTRGSLEHVAAVRAARALIAERLARANAHYGLAHGRVSVRSQRTLWGSCSRRGNLSFNYKVVHLPMPLVDYLVTHELCHLQEPNHSKRFWALMGETMPDYAERRKELRRYVL